MANKKYYAYVQNESGASDDVPMQTGNKNELKSFICSRYDRGWTAHTMAVDIDGNGQSVRGKMSVEKEAAAAALNCKLEDVIHTDGPWRGTTYDDGESDWTAEYTDQSTGKWVTIYTYAHDPVPRAGEVHEAE